MQRADLFGPKRCQVPAQDLPHRFQLHVAIEPGHALLDKVTPYDVQGFAQHIDGRNPTQ